MRTEPDADSAPDAAQQTREAVAREAYFIAQERMARGECGDPVEDWLAAESRLAARVSPRIQEASAMNGPLRLLSVLLVVGVVAYQLLRRKSEARR